MGNEIYSIGYSSYAIADFIKAIIAYRIDVIADVRSQPYSRHKPEYNRESLKQTLKRNGIAYAFLGDQCGARIQAPECYVNGKVSFELVTHNKDFQTGLQRLRKGMQVHRIAIMCAERDPINCHRAILICRNLRAHDVVINHIVDNGLIENHLDTEKRLIRIHGLDKALLYPTEAERLDEAYRLQSDVIAYVESTQDVEKGDRERMNA
jgi:uncharacterized protein (DUF488 family)